MAYPPIMPSTPSLAPISGSAFLISKGEIVYAWRRNNEYLYVGHTRCGLSRIYSHPIIGIREPMQAFDVVELLVINEGESGPLLAASLIQTHKPKYNLDFPASRTCRTLVCPRCGNAFKQSRFWQKFCCKP